MSFGIDEGSLALPLTDMTLMPSVADSTRNTRRSQLGKSGSKAILCTCSPPDVERRVLDKSTKSVMLPVNDRLRSS